jgi:hypothetical protein
MQMSDYRYSLPREYKPAGKITCPRCGTKRALVRYVDNLTGEYLPEEYGRCDREDKCGYHLNPYSDKYKPASGNVASDAGVGILRTLNKNQKFENVCKSATLHTPATLTSFIPPDIFDRSRRRYEEDNFVNYLTTIFGPSVALRLVSRYQIGTSKHWPGSTVFWQVDPDNNVCAGKVMLYNSNNGKRVKEPFNHVSWVHATLKLEGYTFQQCLFGAHLLKKFPSNPVAVVESEKTAVISSAFLPKFLWLAVGGKCELKPSKLEILKGRKVVLWPDLNAYDKWKVIAENYGFGISELLEKRANDEQRANGYDLADFLVRRNGFGLALNDYEYPVAWDL